MAAFPQTRTAFAIQLFIICNVIATGLESSSISHRLPTFQSVKILTPEPGKNGAIGNSLYLQLDAPPVPPILSDTFHKSLLLNVQPAKRSLMSTDHSKAIPLRLTSQLRDAGEEGGFYYGGPFIMNSIIHQLYNRAQAQAAAAAAAAAANPNQNQGGNNNNNQGGFNGNGNNNNNNNNGNNNNNRPRPRPQQQPRPTVRPSNARVNPPPPALLAMVLSMIHSPYPYYGYED